MKHATTVTGTMITAAMLAFGGCGLPSVEDEMSSFGGSSGTDKLEVTQKGGGFTLIWEKRSSGYSEVGLDSGYVGNGERADKLVVSDNYSGRHTLACAIESYSSSSVSVGCYGEGPDFMGGTHEIEQHFSVSDGTLYRFYQTYGAMSSERYSKDSGYRLSYSDGTLNVTKP